MTQPICKNFQDLAFDWMTSVISQIEALLKFSCKHWVIGLGVCLFADGFYSCIMYYRFCLCINTWWRHQMETFSALLAICAGNSPVPGEFPTQRPVTRSFDVYFDLRSDKRLSKQSWGWWFETLSHSLWRHRNDISDNTTSRPHPRQRVFANI